VAHLSLYEADAFARWWSAQHPGQAPVRLPDEAEWEHAAAAGPPAAANLLETQALRALPAHADQTVQDVAGPLQLFGDLWEWTTSGYGAYPGFRAWDGAVGEYNAKIMIKQNVLRGGSCAIPRSHIRASYRNFFPAAARWQFSGLRLARDPG